MEDFSLPILEWVAMKDESGSTYYYNESTGESQWEPPDGYAEITAKSDSESNPSGSGGNQEWVRVQIYIL